MNAIYRIVWNAATGKWVVASELAKGRKKSSARMASIAVATLGLAFGGQAALAQSAPRQGDACTTLNAQEGMIDASGVCKVETAGSDSQNARSIGTMAAVDDAYLKINATGTAASATGSGSIAIGDNARTVASSGFNAGSIALGQNTTAAGANAVAIGLGASANSNNGSGTSGSTAVGATASASGWNSTALGYGAVASNTSSTAVGRSSQATGERSIAIGGTASGQYSMTIGGVASATNSIALGRGSVADRADTVAVGGGGATRQIINMAAGTSANDAVNVSQLAPVVNALGGGAAFNAATGAVTGPTYSVGGTDVYNVGDALSNLDGRVTQNTGDIVDLGDRVTVNEGDITKLKNGTLGLVQQNETSGDITVAAGTDGKRVDFTGTDGARKLTGVAEGELSSTSVEAVNGSQLFSTNERVTKNEGDIVSIGSRVTSTETNISGLDGRVTKNEGDIVNLQNNATAATRYFKADGWNDGTDDAAASGSFAVAMGASATATSKESIAIGWGASAGTNEGTIAIGASSSATGENSVALGNGSVADRDNVVSVGWGMGGNGTRQIVNVTNGTENTDAVNVQQLKPAIAALGGGAALNASSGVVTGPQYTVADLDNGGSKTVDNVGDALGQLNANTTHLDGRVTKNEGDIVDLGDRINNGSLGLVQQAGASAAVTVAAATGGALVDFTGTDGTRQLKGVSEGSDGTDAVNVMQLRSEIAKASAGDTRYFKADGANDGSDDAINSGSRSVAMGAGSKATADNAVALGAGSVADRANTVSVGSVGNERQIANVADGTEDTDAVNVRQLKSAGLVGDDGSVMDAVVYDAGSNRSSITLGGVAGTTITNVMAGLVAPGSMDAINGSQLWGVQDQINQLGDRVTHIENGSGNGGGQDPVLPINPGTGSPHFAASGDADKPATATGSSSVAAGEAAAATGSNSTAIGAGSNATGNNAVAIGAGSVADSDNTVSVGSVGNERRITNVAAGTQRTDAANVGQLQDAMSNLQDWTQGQVNGLSKKVDNVQRQANRGIAASAALVNNMPYLPGKVTLNAGVAAYRGQSALGVGVSRWSDNGRFNVNAGISAAQGDAPIFRVGVGVVLGD